MKMIIGENDPIHSTSFSINFIRWGFDYDSKDTSPIMQWKQMISQLPYFVLIRLVILREAAKRTILNQERPALKIAAYLLNKTEDLIKNWIKNGKKRVSC